MSILERAAAFERDHDRKTLAVGPHEWTYYDGGDGEVVLLLPGGTGMAIGWLDLTPVLLQDFRVIAVEYPYSAASYDELAEGIAAILDAEGIDGVHAVGQSAGGILGEVVSRRIPDRVRSIVLTSTGLYGPEDISRLEGRVSTTRATPWEETLVAVEQQLRATWKDSDEADFWVERVDAATRAAGQLGAVNSFLRLLDQAQRVAEFRTESAWRGPTLLLRADDDPLITDIHIGRLRNAHPDCEFRTFPDGGHSLLLTRTDDYIATVTEFVRKQRADGR